MLYCLFFNFILNQIFPDVNHHIFLLFYGILKLLFIICTPDHSSRILLPSPSAYSYAPSTQADLLPYPVPDTSATVSPLKSPSFPVPFSQSPEDACPVFQSASYSDTSSSDVPSEMSSEASRISRLPLSPL